MSDRAALHRIIQAATGKTCIGEVAKNSGIHAAMCDAFQDLIDGERRRIRRAQREALLLLVRIFDDTDNRLLHDALLKAHEQLSAATRAPRRKR